ncbi:hypothetical protein R3P38DRAFT_1550658 [Favolaschia claudopus]|uniref:Uncharacterized protein n=1 Tax=Favolaschia claudopus TaxID=2862362 RepID=A0AAW0AJ75_9AGAR
MLRWSLATFTVSSEASWSAAVTGRNPEAISPGARLVPESKYLQRSLATFAASSEISWPAAGTSRNPEDWQVQVNCQRFPHSTHLEQIPHYFLAGIYGTSYSRQNSRLIPLNNTRKTAGYALPGAADVDYDPLVIFYESSLQAIGIVTCFIVSVNKTPYSGSHMLAKRMRLASH